MPLKVVESDGKHGKQLGSTVFHSILLKNTDIEVLKINKYLLKLSRTYVK